MKNKITADDDTLLRQAPMTAGFYLSEAISAIDTHFGKGYAQRNPQLVGEFIRASATDFHTCMSVKTMEAVAEALEDIATSCRDAATAFDEKITRFEG